jgi:signal transduction histidine kinase
MSIEEIPGRRCRTFQFVLPSPRATAPIPARKGTRPCRPQFPVSTGGTPCRCSNTNADLLVAAVAIAFESNYSMFKFRSMNSRHSNLTPWTRWLGMNSLPRTGPNAPVLMRYAIGITSTLLAATVRIALIPVLGEHHPYTFFFAAIAITSWIAGFWPSVVAILLSYLLADWLFVPPIFELNFDGLDDYVGLGGFLFSGLAIAFTSKALHAARQQAEARQRELAREMSERERIAAELQVARGELEAHAALLEKTVERRTANLVATIQSLEGVCYHLAHDLRAPLRAMQGYAAILLDVHSDRPNTESQRYLRCIHASALRMDTLLCCLMEYGRVGHQRFVWQSVDLEAQFEEILREFAGPIQTSEAEIKLVRPLPRIWGSRTLVRLVLTHLVGNALNFVAPGVKPRLQIQAHIGESTARLWIHDNGIGIPPEYHEKIFRIFERLTLNGTHPGTGIGLAIVAKAMQRMGGHVGLESEPGKGSRFWIEFLLPPKDENRNTSTRLV